jgi:hypothetical protein
VEHASAVCLVAEEARRRRIESDAIRTRVAFAVFAWLDVRDEASRTLEQARELRAELSDGLQRTLEEPSSALPWGSPTAESATWTVRQGPSFPASVAVV